MAVIHQRGQPMNFMRLHWHFSITTPRCKDLFFARPPFCQSILSERIGCESIRRMVSARCVGTRHPLPFRLWRRFGSPGGGCAAPANPTAGASAVAATSSRPEWRPGDRWVYGWMSRSEIGTKTVKVVESARSTRSRPSGIRGMSTSTGVLLRFASPSTGSAGEGMRSSKSSPARTASDLG